MTDTKKADTTDQITEILKAIIEGSQDDFMHVIYLTDGEQTADTGQSAPNGDQMAREFEALLSLTERANYVIRGTGFPAGSRDQLAEPTTLAAATHFWDSGKNTHLFTITYTGVSVLRGKVWYPLSESLEKRFKAVKLLGHIRIVPPIDAVWFNWKTQTYFKRSHADLYTWMDLHSTWVMIDNDGYRGQLLRDIYAGTFVKSCELKKA